MKQIHRKPEVPTGYVALRDAAAQHKVSVPQMHYAVRKGRLNAKVVGIVGNRLTVIEKASLKRWAKQAKPTKRATVMSVPLDAPLGAAPATPTPASTVTVILMPASELTSFLAGRNT